MILHRIILILPLVLWVACATTQIDPLTEPRASEFNKKGQALLSKGNYDDAIVHFQKAIELEPDYADAYINRGEAYASGKGEIGLALQDYNKALKLSPENARAYYHRGKAYKQKGDFRSAIVDYTTAIRLNPNYTGAYVNRGVIYARDIKRYDLAISDFDKAIEMSPDMPETYFNKALACEKSGRNKEAVEAYRAFMEHASVEYNQFIDFADQKIRNLQEEE